MGPAESDLVGLIGLIYDVLQNPPRWAEFLEQYARALGAYVTFIHRHRFRERSSEIVTSFGLSSPIRAAYHAHYSAMNVWRNTGEHLYVAGHILRDPEIMPRPVLVKSEFYNDFLFPIGGVHSVAAVIAREGEEALVLTALNHYSDRAWDEHDKKPIECVLAHLRRAHAIEQRIQVLEAEETFLDTLEAGVVFLSGDGRLVRLNRAARDILRQSDGLTVRNGKFVARNSVVDARLQQTIHQDGSGCVPLDAASAIAVPRPSGKRAYQVITAPLRQRLSTFAGQRPPTIVAVIVDAHAVAAPPLAVLAKLYGLTKREAALAGALAAGGSLAQAAEELGITYETARSHLRSVFQKTETSRQSELVLLLSRLSSTHGDG